jgi:class 3 adenylate cyclase/tetratricopeptide (TPR) repeat protein
MAGLVCSSCGAENASGRKFCLACGAPLAVTCAACGALNEPIARFCGECAAPLDAAPTPDARTAVPASAPVPAPVAERRLVSVLFADLVGFTPFAEERDAEEVRETLTRYFDLARDVIARYGGTVEKFIGDAVMAVWGAPTAHEDDAERAVRAGLELVDAVKGLGPSIQARAAVLTGEAAVTLGATEQGLVAGDLVNTASRLQSVAAPGTVLVGEATHRAASRAIAFEAAGTHTLKGKPAPLPAWRALRVVAERGGRNRAETLEPPFVGRDEEFRLLKESLHATGREQRARLVSIIGPAGIGKSRLAGELGKYADGLIDAPYWHVGRSPAYGDGITFWALGEMVRRRAGLAETADEATTRAKLAETVAAWIADADERRWIEPALLALLGLERASAPEELFGAWRTFFERIAAHGTVTLVFEDLHWADAGTLAFIDHLLDWSRNAPIYVVTLARPELLEQHPDWGAGKRNFISLHLEPLPAAVMRELLGGLIPGLPAAAMRDIVARADGVPLYAVETVRMLVADGKLRLEGEVYVPAGDLTELAVPETLTALIAARLDGLAPADRSLLQDAAVLGQSFTLDSLAAVSGEAHSALEGRLRALVRGELLALEADPRSPERGQYRFVQALIREVAYHTLAHRDRKAKHLAVARSFESLGSDELAGALAGHYLAAHAYAAEGAEADALAAQARVALRAAAERAVGLGSYSQAVRFLEQAVTVTTDPAEQAELLERAGRSASVANRHEAAERHLRRAIEMHRQRGDRAAAARATASLGRALHIALQADTALTLLEAAQVEFADLDAGPEKAALGLQHAWSVMLNGDQRRGVELADPVLEMAEHLDLVPIVVDAFRMKGYALAWIGRTAESLALLRAGEELADKHGLVEALIRATTSRAGVETGLDPRSGLEIARAGLPLARRVGILMPNLIANAVFAALRVGEWPWAQRILDEVLVEDLEPSDRTNLLGMSIFLRAVRGDPTEDEMAELERLSAGATDPARPLWLLEERAFLAFAAGRLSEAHADWREAIEGSNSTVGLPLPARAARWSGDLEAAHEDLALYDAAGVHGPAPEADRQTMRAGIAALEGRPEDALALYREALQAWRDLGLAWDEALCGMEMALLLDPSDPEVRAAAESAREILSRLEARPFLERLEARMEEWALEPGRRP